MATRRASKGTVLQLSIASVFTTVALVKKIDYPDDETQFYDGTALDSTDVEDGEVSGFSVPGMVNADLFFDPLDTAHKQLISSKASRAYESWKITNPNIGATTAHACTFNGAIKTFKPTATIGGALEANLQVKLRSVCAYSTAV